MIFHSLCCLTCHILFQPPANVLLVQHTRLPSSLHAFPTEKNLAAFHSRRTAQGVVDAAARVSDGAGRNRWRGFDHAIPVRAQSPAVIHELPWLDALYTRLGFGEYRPFIQLLGVVSIVLVVGSSLFKTLTLHVLNRFVHLQRHSLSTRLLSRYLHQPYEFFLTRNPSVLAKNVLSEVDQLVFDLIQPLSQLLAQGVLVLAMVALIFTTTPSPPPVPLPCSGCSMAAFTAWRASTWRA